MNIRNIHILRTLATLLLCVVAGSCSQDELGIEYGKTLPPGKYPLMFTATVDRMMSRAVENESWVKGDEIAVQIDNYPVIGCYKLNEDGSVKESDDPLSWPYMEGCVKAWYPFVALGNTLEREIIDQSTGFHDIDFLYAATGKENYKNTIHLSFKHHMAKVCCKLFKGDGVTDEDIATAKVSFAGYPKASFKEGALSGSYIEGKEVNEWITPTSDFTALLVPQDMSGKELIKINLNVTVNGVGIDKEMIYTPSEAKLEAGKAYTFNIIVRKDRLEVQTISGAWTESLENTVSTSDKYQIYLPVDTEELGELEFSKNVITEGTADTRAGSDRLVEVIGNSFTISFKTTLKNYDLGLIFVNKNTKNQAKRIYFEKESDGYYEFTYTIASPIGEPVSLEIGEHVEVGDYLFNDGKWGGIPEKIYSQGEKTPVGIVFKVGAGGDSQHNTLDVPSNYGWTDNREIRGYAVALNDASTGRLYWSTKTGTLDVVVEYNDKNIVYIKYSGITATKNAKDKGINNYPAFKAVIEYPTSAPEGSSGWYLPSYRQLTDIRNLFKHPQRRELITKAGGNFFYQETKYRYCSATERSGSSIWLQGFVYTENFSANTGITVNKPYGYFARGVLTF